MNTIDFKTPGKRDSSIAYLMVGLTCIPAILLLFANNGFYSWFTITLGVFTVYVNRYYRRRMVVLEKMIQDDFTTPDNEFYKEMKSQSRLVMACTIFMLWVGLFLSLIVGVK